MNAILSFVTILLSNLTRQPSVNYLLSHPVMGCLTLTKFGNMNNEIADYYINFLKVLSRKITAQNLHLFYNEVSISLFSVILPFPSYLKPSDSSITQKAWCERPAEISFSLSQRLKALSFTHSWLISLLRPTISTKATF